MRKLLFLLNAFFLLFYSNIRADELSRQQQNLNLIYVDDEQVFNEAQARARLIEENFKAANATLNKAVPEINNLLFKMRGEREPSLAIRRQTSLVVKYEADFKQAQNQLKDHSTSIEIQIKDTCEQIEKWKLRGKIEATRSEVLDSARKSLQATLFRIQKMQELLDLEGKAVNKISGLRDVTARFAAEVDNLIKRADNLLGPVEQARSTWQEQQKELILLPLKLKTLELLKDNAEKVLALIKQQPSSNEEQRYSAEQIEIMADRYTHLQKNTQAITTLSKQIEEQLSHFDTDVKSLKEVGIQIATPFHNGLLDSLEDYVRNTKAQLVEGTLLKETALGTINKLRVCMGQIEVAADSVQVPNLQGILYDQAEALLKELQLKVVKKIGEPAPQKSLSGHVYDQSPAAEQKATPESIVTVYVYGTYTPIVPDLIGKTADEVMKILARQGMKGVAKEGEAAPDKELEGIVYNQLPRAFVTGVDGGSVEFTYYSRMAELVSDQQFSTVPFYVLCRLYVPRLKPDAPSKEALTIKNITFVERSTPFVVEIRDSALDRYSLTFFEPSKAFSTFIQIVGKEGQSGLSSQYDGALLLEVVRLYTNLDELNQRLSGAVDLSQQDPLAFITITQSNGLFSGSVINDAVQLRWRGGPIMSGWSAHMKEESFSLFRQLL